MILSGVDFVVKGYPTIISPLGCAAAPRVIHKNLAHKSGRQSQEIATGLSLERPLLRQPEVSLIDQCCRLKGVIRALSSQVTVRQSVELVVNQRKQRLQDPLIACVPTGKQLVQRLWWKFRH